MSHSRILSFSFCFLMTVLSCFSQQNRNTSFPNFPFKNPTPGEITIMAIDPIPADVTPSREAFHEFIACGFNLASSRGSVSYFKNVFALLGDLKLKYLIGNPKFTEPNTRKEYINNFKNDPHLGGWFLKDEPAYTSWDELSELYKAFSKEDPDHLIYINLVGMINENFTGKCKTIAEYLNLYQNKFLPSLLSYDYYPIININGKTQVKYDQFYSDLEVFSAMAKKTSRPFWAFCESMAYKNKWNSRPAPTEPYLKFEAFNALAYGAQGIVYWTYSLRNSTPIETYISSLVDLKGKKSKAWYAAQKVNMEIKKFNHIFYQCEVKEVKHTGKTQYQDTKKLTGTIGPLKSVSSGAAGVLISRIENNGEKYMVIVNHDPFNKQKVTLKLNSGKSVVNLTAVNQVRYSGTGNINLTLDKADWVILKEG